jgi:hypothetical protein
LHLSTLLLLGVSPCEVLVLFASFPTTPSSSKMKSVCIFYHVFEFGGFTGSFLKEVFTSSYLVFYLLLILGFYGLHWIDIFLSFSKSPSLLKSESESKVIAFFVRIFSASSELDLDRKFNQKSTEKLQNCFLIFLALTEFKLGIQPGISGLTGNSSFAPNG